MFEIPVWAIAWVHILTVGVAAGAREEVAARDRLSDAGHPR